MLFLIILIVFLSIFCCISIYNFFTAPVLKKSNEKINNDKLVSILIPARNEENNIAACIISILEQTYSNKEIIVLDDCSNDKTFQIASAFSKKNVKVIKGESLPEDWLGKNWACHQLANKANGDYLLFIDADVSLKTEAISESVIEMEKSYVELISIFPSQIIKSFGEFLVVPLMNWLLLNFLPLKQVFTSNNVSFVAANGQFMLWRRKTYFELGGHEKVKNKIVEDMELARNVKGSGLKMETMLGGKLVFCKMYNSFFEAYNGFTKNFYPGFSLHPVTFVFFILFIFTIFFVPIILIDQSVLAIIPFVLVIISRIFIAVRSKLNLVLSILLHPIQMIIFLWIGITSIVKFKTNSLTWKERSI